MPTVDIRLDGGLVLKDPRNLPPGTFAVLDNADFSPLRKRHGHDSIRIESNTNRVFNSALNAWAYGYGQYLTDEVPVVDPSESAVGQIRGVATHKDELLAWDGWRLFSRDTTPLGKAVRIGGSFGSAMMPHAKETQLPVGEHYIDSALSPPSITSQTYQTIDMAVGTHRTLYAWTYNGVARFAVYDNATGAPVISSRELDFDFAPSVVRATYSPHGAAGTFYITASKRDSSYLISTIVLSELRLDGRTDYDGVLVDVNDEPDGRYFDVRPASEGRLLCVTTATTAYIAVVYVRPDGSTGGSNYVTDEPIAAQDIGCAVHPDGTIMVAWSEEGSPKKIKSVFLNGETLAPLYAEVAVDETGTSRISCEFRLRTVLGVYNGVVAWWDATDREVFAREVLGGATNSTVVSVADCCLAHQIFRVGQAVMIPIAYNRRDYPAQSQLVLTSFDRGKGFNFANQIIPIASSLRQGKWFVGEAATSPFKFSAAIWPNQEPENPTRYSVASETARVRAALDGTTVVQVQDRDGVARVDYDFLPPLRFAQVGQSTWFAGGLVQEYDGVSVQEAGFLTYPEPETAIEADTDSTFLAGEVIQYRAYLTRRNANGELHRSAALTVTATVTTDGDNVQLTLPVVPFTSTDDFNWEIYKTDPGGSVFKRWTTETPGTDIRNTPVTLTDTGSVNIATNPTDPAPSYTDAGFGVLDRIIPPSCQLIGAGKQRIWFGGGGVPDNQVAYTRLWDSNEAPAWNEALVQEVSGTGPITGLGFLGDWCLPFRLTATYVFGGPGPDNLGLGNFDDTRLAVQETGCISPDSLVSLVPVGIGFQGQSGIRVIDSGLNVALIGNSVDIETNYEHPVIASAVGRKAKQARWTTSEATYVFDYSESDRPRWTKWTYTALGSTEYQGAVVVAPADHKNCIWIESDAGNDGGIRYSFDCLSGWLYPAVEAGGSRLDWGRLDWFALCGDWLGPHKLRGRIDYDHRIAPVVDDWTWEPTTPYAVDVEATGDAAGTTQDIGAPMTGLFGASPSPVWYQDGPLLGTKRFRRSRAGTFRFGLSDTGSPGPSFSLSSVAIEYRPTPGIGKGSDTRNFG